MKIVSFLLISLLLLMQSINLFAHGDTHERIATINQLLLEDPDNAMLYYKRACLYLDHNELTNALIDLDKSAEINPELNIVFFKKADLFYKLELYNDALKNINHYLSLEKEKAEFALLAKARIYSKLSEFDKSVQVYKQVLETNIPELPEVYFELVDVYIMSDDNPHTNAVECLKSGIEKFGDIHSFHQKIISLHVQFGKKESAIEYIDELINRMPRKESWYKTKADILIDLGRTNEALSEYNLALASIDLLSEHRKNTENIINLKQKIEIAIKNLTTD